MKCFNYKILANLGNYECLVSTGSCSWSMRRKLYLCSWLCSWICVCKSQTITPKHTLHSLPLLVLQYSHMNINVSQVGCARSHLNTVRTLISIRHREFYRSIRLRSWSSDKNKALGAKLNILGGYAIGVEDRGLNSKSD